MHFSRISRQKKRKVLLRRVRAKPKARPPMSHRPPTHNAAGIERLWYDSCFRSHGACCGCANFVNHLLLLATRYGFQAGPPAPGGPRGAPALRALPPPGEANPGDGEQQPWRGDGGGREEGNGGRGGDAAGDAYGQDDLDALFAAVEEEQQ